MTKIPSLEEKIEKHLRNFRNSLENVPDVEEIPYRAIQGKKQKIISAIDEADSHFHTLREELSASGMSLEELKNVTQNSPTGYAAMLIMHEYPNVHVALVGAKMILEDLDEGNPQAISSDVKKVLDFKNEYSIALATAIGAIYLSTDGLTQDRIISLDVKSLGPIISTKHYNKDIIIDSDITKINATTACGLIQCLKNAIRVHRESGQEKNLTIGVKSNDYNHFLIENDGPSLSREQASKLGTGYSTKKANEASGFGTQILKRIAELKRQRVVVNSRNGEDVFSYDITQERMLPLPTDTKGVSFEVSYSDETYK